MCKLLIAATEENWERSGSKSASDKQLGLESRSVEIV